MDLVITVQIVAPSRIELLYGKKDLWILVGLIDDYFEDNFTHDTLNQRWISWYVGLYFQPHLFSLDFPINYDFQIEFGFSWDEWIAARHEASLYGRKDTQFEANRLIIPALRTRLVFKRAVS